MKQVQSLTRFDMLNVSQNSKNISKLGFALSFTSILNLPVIIILAYLFKRFDRWPKRVSMFELHGDLYVLKIAHLLFLMVISDNII